MRSIRVTCFASAVVLLGVAAVAQTESSHIQRQTIQRSFPSSPGLRVVLDAVSGSIQAWVEGKREDGMYVYRLNNSTQITVGKGGPVWSLETLNGNIYIRRRNS